MSETERVVILGAGGHAKVCIEIFRDMGIPLAYCIGGEGSPEKCLDVSVVIGDTQIHRLYAQGYRKFFVAIGSNVVRQKLADMALGLGFELVNAISPKAVISDSAKLRRGIAVMPGAIINAEAFIDDLAIINTGATIDHDCQIGRAVHIAPQCALAGKVSVGQGSFLGIGCKVIPEINIGSLCVAGAGSVIVRDIPSNTQLCGVPAKKMY